jgi:hypothetical protein
MANECCKGYVEDFRGIDLEYYPELYKLASQSLEIKNAIFDTLEFCAKWINDEFIEEA